MIILIFSYLADLIFGKPQNFPHPVRGIGWIIKNLEKNFNKFEKDNEITNKIKGAALAIIVISIVAISAYIATEISKTINYLFGLIVSIYIAYVSFTIKDLIKHANDVYKEIEKDIEKARKNLAKIVTRDTKNLDEEHIIKSTIESTSENLNDAFVAPLFYLIFLGPVMAIIYLTVNTLDAMIGYKNKRFINFGWFSAKLDDILNFIPARITGILICFSAFLLERNFSTFKHSFKIMRRDGRKHESPNSGISEAAMAGALKIKLAGNYSYPDNVKKSKKEIGEDIVKVEKNLIKKCINICLIASFIWVMIGIIIKFLLNLFYG